MRNRPRLALIALGLVVACAHGPRPSPVVLALASLPRIAEARISPDGQTLAYVSDASGSPELWAISTTGGAARPLTRLRERVDHPRFTRDGRALIAVADKGGDDRYDLLRVPLDGAAAYLARTPRSETEPELSPTSDVLAFLADPETAFRKNLFVRDLATGAERQLTKGEPSVTGPRWSRDGRFVALTRTPDTQKGHLLVVDTKTGESRRVEPPVHGGILWAHAFGEGGRLLVSTRNEAGFTQLAIVEGATVTRIGPGDWDVEEAIWHPESGIYFLRNEGGVSALWRMASPTSRAERVYASAGVLSSLDVDGSGKRLAYLEARSDAPVAVILREGATQRAVVRTELPTGLRLGAGEMIHFSHENLEIHAFVTEPTTTRQGTPPPCVVLAHGGPEGQARPELNLYAQALASAGFLVVQPNYRGGSGQGQRFMDANNKDWGGGDLRDLVATVEHLRRAGRIDPKRVGIMGGSYGGYLTLMALATKPEVFAAGVDLYGMPDLVADYELTKDRFGPWYETEMGTPKTHAALFRERSPLTHLDRLRAPLLVLQGKNDTNVPQHESDLVVSRLRARRHPVEYVVYADEGHGFEKKKNRLDAAARTVDFFERKLGIHGEARPR